MSPIWMRRFHGLRVARALAMARLKCGQCGAWRHSRGVGGERMSFGDGYSRSDKAETGDEQLLTPPTGEGQARDNASTAASTAACAAAEAVARRSYGKLVAFLAARTRDVAAAEDALSEAFAAALTDWPMNGCPSNPEGWLLTVARRKVIDAVRRHSTTEAASVELQILAEGLEAAAAEPAEIPDRRLALLFACAHPAIEA